MGFARHRARVEALCVLAAFAPLLVEWAGYVGRLPRLSYACLVPLLALLLLARERPDLRAREVPRALGSALLLGAALLLLTGTLAGVFTLALAGFPLALAGVLARWTSAADLRRSTPALVLLAALVPPPMPLLDALNPALIRASGAAAVALLAPLDPAAAWAGSTLTFRGWTLLVSEACSGSGTFLALAVCALFLGGLFRMRAAALLAVLLLAPPLTLLVNGLRIAVSAVLIERFGPAAGAGLPHELLGQALFLAGAIALAVLVDRLGAARAPRAV